MAAISILSHADVVVSTCVGAANEVIVNAASVTQGTNGGVFRYLPTCPHPARPSLLLEHPLGLTSVYPSPFYTPYTPPVS